MSAGRGKFGIFTGALLALGAGVFVAMAAAASVPACPTSHTDVRISKDVEEPRVDYSKRATQLETMKFRDPVATDRTFARVAGLTVAAIAVDSEIRIASTGSSAGEPTCAWPSVVSIKLSTAPTVYVGADHGVCSREVGLGHEMQHVAIDKKVIDMYGPIFRRRLGAMIDAMNEAAPEPGLDVDSWRARIEEKINAVIAVTSDSLNDDRANQHRSLDSPGEYLRLSYACPIVTVDPKTAAARANMPRSN
jgi:hypothetical protein